MKLAFFGTGEFAAPAFVALARSRHQVLALVTQPDRSGPGKHRHEQPLKALAADKGIPVLQPDNVNAPEVIETLRSLGADLFVVAAYGQILRREFLAIPRLGAINIHASLLPRHRGAAPINYAILAGDRETGVTVFQIVRKLDAGPWLGMISTPIEPNETAGELEVRLSKLGAHLIVDVVEQLEKGTVRGVPQDDSFATLAPKMPKSAGEIDWTKSAPEIERHVRAMQPWPTAYSHLIVEGQPPLRVAVARVKVDESAGGPGGPGEVIRAGGNGIAVRAGEGTVLITRLQPAGKRAMTAEEFLRGRSVPVRSFFGVADSSS